MDKAFCTFYSFLLGDLEPFELKTAALWFNTILIDVPDQKLWEERNNLFLQNSGLDA